MAKKKPVRSSATPAQVAVQSRSSSEKTPASDDGRAFTPPIEAVRMVARAALDIAMFTSGERWPAPELVQQAVERLTTLEESIASIGTTWNGWHTSLADAVRALAGLSRRLATSLAQGLPVQCDNFDSPALKEIGDFLFEHICQAEWSEPPPSPRVDSFDILQRDVDDRRRTREARHRQQQNRDRLQTAWDAIADFRLTDDAESHRKWVQHVVDLVELLPQDNLDAHLSSLVDVDNSTRHGVHLIQAAKKDRKELLKQISDLKDPADIAAYFDGGWDKLRQRALMPWAVSGCPLVVDRDLWQHLQNAGEWLPERPHDWPPFIFRGPYEPLDGSDEAIGQYLQALLNLVTCARDFEHLGRLGSFDHDDLVDDVWALIRDLNMRGRCRILKPKDYPETWPTDKAIDEVERLGAMLQDALESPPNTKRHKPTSALRGDGASPSRRKKWQKLYELAETMPGATDKAVVTEYNRRFKSGLRATPAVLRNYRQAKKRAQSTK